MKPIAQKIADITGGDPEIIETILKEGANELDPATKEVIKKNLKK